MEEKVINLNEAIEKNKVNSNIEEQINKKSEMYKGDFKWFQQFSEQKGLKLTFETLEAYLNQTVETGLKISTFNRAINSEVTEVSFILQERVAVNHRLPSYQQREEISRFLWSIL